MRLIDGDALTAKFGIGHDCSVCEHDDTPFCQWKPNAVDICEAIYEAPTIEPEPKWIPCSERLPEEDDYKSCIECLDGAVWYFTENGTMGLGYYYKSTKEWSTTDDLKTDGKVVAWMPLPEPYREGGGE